MQLIALAIATATLLAAGAPSHRQGPETFVEKVPGTLVSFKMVRLPDGEFDLRGVKTKVKGVWMGETEITWDLYDIWALRFDLTDDQNAKGVDAEARPSRPYGAPDRGFGHQGYPALGMAYHAAQRFCEWLRKKTGHKYRLPTEAEWRYAAGSPQDLAAEAWTWENGDDATHPVGKMKPNAFGLRDMYGNAREWVVTPDGEQVTLGGSYYDKNATITPEARWPYSIKWQDRDPQRPKSKWWLSDGPFVGMRLVCER